MKRIFSFLFILLLAFSTRSYADHILGGTIGYKFVSSSGETSTYKVTMELYISCLGATMGGPANRMNLDPEIFIMKSGAKIGVANLKYQRSQSDVEITPVCPDYANTTSCKNPDDNDFIGIVKYVYTSNVDITGTDTDWEFSFFGRIGDPNTAQVSSFIENAEVEHPSVSPPPIYDVMYLTARLNNTMGPNNSPTFTAPPIPFFCTGKLSYYGMGAADDDNDVLKFKMIPARKTTGYTNVTQTYSVGDANYLAPFTGEKPLSTAADSFYFNTTNGQIIFRPDTNMVSLVAIQADEYKDGVLVGSSMRQMCFFVYNDCNAEVANTDVSAIVHADQSTDAEGNLYFSACEGQMDTASFEIAVTDPNNDNVTVTYDNIPSSGSVSVDNNGTQNPTVHFKWFLTDAQPATYFFYLTYTDDGCPVATQKNIAYNFTVVPHNIQFESGSSGSCATVADGKAWIKPIGNVTVNYTYRWYDAAGNEIRNASSTSGDQISNIPPGTYLVRARNPEGCGKNITVVVDTTLPPVVSLPNDSTVCEGMPIRLATEREEGVDYLWNSGQDSCCIITHTSGNYILTASNHCGTTTGSVRMDFVKCNYCFFVPNAFSPNGDGQNDVFKITPTCLFSTFKLQVFDREGKLMYVSYSLDDSWDGTFKGKEAPQAVYFYVLEGVYADASRGRLKLKGDVTLLR